MIRPILDYASPATEKQSFGFVNPWRLAFRCALVER